LEIKRRDFLKLLAISGAASVGGAWSARAILDVPDEVFQRVLNGPRLETWKNSICSMCPGGCGISVRLIDSIPVRITGNPQYPLNAGATCPLAEAGIELLFHPKRIQQPLRRLGERGSDKWEPISWEEALATISDRLNQLRLDGHTEKLFLVSRARNEMITDLSQQFMASFGSSNFSLLNQADILSPPIYLTQASDQPVAYDISNTDFLLNFGFDLLDEGPNPVRYNQLYVQLRNRKNPQPGRIVHASPYMSRTAVNSSEWLAIKPGSSGALALGMANVIIRDGSYDADFTENNSFGFSEWKDSSGETHLGFKELVTSMYSPERVSTITGLPANSIVAIAREFAAAKSAIAFPEKFQNAGANDLYNSFAVHCLNALTGNLNHEGGVLYPKALFAHQTGGPNRPSNHKHKLLEGIYDNGLLNVKDSEIDTLIFHQVNPLFNSSSPDQLKEKLAKIPLIISCTTVLDETAAFADLVLPEPSYLEKWEINHSIPTVGFQHFGVQQPIIDPLYDTRQFGDILLELSKNIQDPDSDKLSWKSYNEYIRDAAEGVYNSGQGTIISKNSNQTWLEFLKDRGWQALEYSTFAEFWNVLLAEGGWWDPISSKVRTDQLFNTKSGKFDFYSLSLMEAMNSYVFSPDNPIKNMEELLAKWSIHSFGDQVYLPHFEAPRFDSESFEYPYHFMSYRLITNNPDIAVPLGLAQELSGLNSREFWNPWLEINPETAKAEDIYEDDLISLVSSKGTITARVRILPTVMPGTVMMPSGRFGGALSANPAEILSTEMDLLAGSSSQIYTRVKIVKNPPKEKV